MKILVLFSHPWWGGRAGGAETHVTQLIEELTRRGHEIVFVTSTGKKGVTDPPGIVAAEYQLPFHRPNPFELLKVYRGLVEIAEKHQIEIAHAHHRTAGFFAECLRRGRRIPYVISIHDTWRRAPFKRFHGWFFRRLIAVSNDIKQEMERQFGFAPGRIRVIYNGVDSAPFEQSHQDEAAQFRQKWGIHDEAVLSVIGRVTRAKGQATLIEALRLIPGGLKLKCLIVGEGKERRKLEQLAAGYGLDEKVRFCGFEANIPAVLQASDIMLLPSFREPFGLVVVEAMFSRTAVICSNAGAIPEITTHDQDGLLFPAGNAAALAQAIELLVTDPALRQRLGEEGYRTAHRRFLLSRMVDDVEDYYAEIISDSTSDENQPVRL